MKLTRMTQRVAAGWGAVAMTFVMFLVAGCEPANHYLALTLTPEEHTFRPEDQTETLTLKVEGLDDQPLALPLTWRVSDPELGTIVSHSGFTAVYRRTDRNGVNTVSVRDQFKNEGFSVINQVAPEYTITLVAEPSSIAVGGASTITIQGADGAQPPYRWTRLSGPGTLVASSSSTSASYSSTRAGVGVLRVTDGNGISAVVSIVVTSTTEGTTTPPPADGGTTPANGSGAPGDGHYAIALTASPASPINVGATTAIAITPVSGMRAPYNWAVIGAGTLSEGANSANSTAVFTAGNAAGTTMIRVTDANGVQGIISIVVTDAASGPGGAGAGGGGGG